MFLFKPSGGNSSASERQSVDDGQARHPRRAFRANGPEALTSAVAAGLGLAAIPCLLGDAQPALVRVEWLGFAMCDLLLVTQEQHRKTPRVRVVSDYVADLVARHRADIEGRRPP